MLTIDQDALNLELRRRRLCRFCLSRDQSKLTNIYMRDTRLKVSAPLPIQIMAIASIEVFSNDGMPSFVCTDCTAVFEYSYQFKQMCKKADNLLRQVPLTGQWPDQLEKPVLRNTTNITSNRPSKLINVQQPIATITKPSKSSETSLVRKVLLNMAPSPSPEPSQPVRTKIEKFDEDSTTCSFMAKLENNDELSLDDIHELVAAEAAEAAAEESNMLALSNLPVVMVDSGIKGKPKVLNKSSVRILNKEVAKEKEPRLSLPKIQTSDAGTMEIVAEILNEDEPYETESDPKNAEVIETNCFPCPHCDRSFPLLQLRDIHIKKHSRDRKFTCEECDKSFFTKYDLQRHSFTHNGAKPYKCSACGKGFSRTSLLQRHEKTHTDIPKYICVTCERPFISKEDLEAHAERHKINRPFQCKLCSKVFAFKQGLERHEQIHSRDQPFSCQYCEESFSTSAKLARHLTAHAGKRPYPCKLCKKSYLLPHHLSRHMRSHKNKDSSNTVSFKCSTCDSSFTTHDEFIRHSMQHADEDNLSCPLCKDEFQNIKLLTAHIAKHTNSETHACEFCDLIFMEADALQRHIDKDHIFEMQAYHEDDRLQVERLMKDNDNKAAAANTSEDNLQTSVDQLLVDDIVENDLSMEASIPVKREKDSPTIVKQIIVRPAHLPDESTDNNSLLIPMGKKPKLEDTETDISMPQSRPRGRPSKLSPQAQSQPKRKTPSIANATVRDKNQPSIQSLLKLPRDVTVTKTLTSPKSNESSEKPKTSRTDVASLMEQSASTSKVVKMKIGDKNVKVQKIRVTKAQAAAMAKEGRIKIKNGQIILTQDPK